MYYELGRSGPVGQSFLSAVPGAYPQNGGTYGCTRAVCYLCCHLPFFWCVERSSHNLPPPVSVTWKDLGDFRDGSFPSPLLARRFFSHGFVSVTFFFQLSGFVNTLVNEARSVDYTDVSWQRRFWYRRGARLGPVYQVMLLCSLPPLIVVWHKMDVPPFQTSLLRSVACVATAAGVQTWDFSVPLWRLWNYPAWAVSCELAFYVAFPFLVPCVKHAVIFTAGIFEESREDGVGWHVFILLFSFSVVGQLGSWYLFEFTLESLGSSPPLAGDVAYT